VYRNLPKEEKLLNRIVLNFPNEYLSALDTSFANFHLISRSLKELYSLAMSSRLSSSESASALSSSSSSSSLLPAKKLEQLAYQACDKIFNRDDNGPYENFRNAAKQILDVVGQVAASLETGEFEKELTDDEFKIRKYMVNSPVQRAADEFKSALVDAENIRLRIEKKDEEIRELKKLLKAKSDELSEQKLRISLVEKKAETQLNEHEDKSRKLTQSMEDMKSDYSKKEKEHSDTIEALQQELDSLQNERRDLKEKLRTTAKNKLFESLAVRQSSDLIGSGGDAKSHANVSSWPESSAMAQEVYFHIR
jgi:dynactin 1